MFFPGQGNPLNVVSAILFFFFFLKDFLIYLFIYLFIFGCVGSSVRARAFSSCGKLGPLFIAVRGPLFIAVRGPFSIVAPPVTGHRLQTRRLSSCSSRAQPLRGTRDLPRPGLEPVSPALAGRLPTTAPPGKPNIQLCISLFTVCKPESRKLAFTVKDKKTYNSMQMIFKLQSASVLIYIYLFSNHLSSWYRRCA